MGFDYITVNPLYNDILYNSKNRQTAIRSTQKSADRVFFSLTVPCYSLGKHTFWILVRIASARRF